MIMHTCACMHIHTHTHTNNANKGHTHEVMTLQHGQPATCRFHSDVIILGDQVGKKRRSYLLSSEDLSTLLDSGSCYARS